MTVPASLVAVPLLAGAAVGALAPLPVGGVRAALVAAWVATLIEVVRRAPPRRVGVLLGVGFALGGAALAATHRAAALHTPLRAWFDRQPAAAGTGRVGPVRLEGRLRRDARVTDYGAAFDLAVSGVGRAGEMVSAPGGSNCPSAASGGPGGSGSGERDGGCGYPRRCVPFPRIAIPAAATRRGGRRCGGRRCAGRSRAACSST